MQTFIDSTGTSWPVSDRIALYPEGPVAWYDQAIADSVRRWRGGEPLDAERRAYVAAWNHRETLQRCADLLRAGGKALADYGFETLDQVHGVSWTPDVAPEAAIEMVFDHHNPGEPVPHRILRHSPHHQHCVSVHDLHAALMDETRHKEEVLDHVCQNHDLGVEQRPRWRFDKARRLELDLTSHPDIDETLWRAGGPWCLSKRFGRPVVVK